MAGTPTHILKRDLLYPREEEMILKSMLREEHSGIYLLFRKRYALYLLDALKLVTRKNQESFAWESFYKEPMFKRRMTLTV